MVGFTLPSALAGSDNEVELNSDGAMTVAKLVGGVAAAVGIFAAGVHLARSGAQAIGADNPVPGDLY